MLYEPISLIPKIKNELTKFIESYIYQRGIAAIQLISEKAINVNFIFFLYTLTFTSIALQDPKLYTETILDIHQKSSKLIQEVFNSEYGFIAALDHVIHFIFTFYRSI
jgi:hypothetical protein